MLFGRDRARLDAERLRPWPPRRLARDEAVLDHAVDDVVAALDRALAVAERVQVGRRLGQRGEIGGLLQRQLIQRLAEIVQRRGGDAIAALPGAGAPR